MPLYDFECPDCGRFEFFVKLENFTETLNCPVCSSPAKLAIVAPAIEGIENCKGNNCLEVGFWNHMVSGPRGDGYFDDRAKYKKWMKSKGYEETSGGGLTQEFKKKAKAPKPVQG